jgi:hypothetical protein
VIIFTILVPTAVGKKIDKMLGGDVFDESKLVWWLIGVMVIVMGILSLILFGAIAKMTYFWLING